MTGTTMEDSSQLGHASSLLAGQAVPAGACWHGSPARQDSASTKDIDPGQLRSLGSRRTANATEYRAYVHWEILREGHLQIRSHAALADLSGQPTHAMPASSRKLGAGLTLGRSFVLSAGRKITPSPALEFCDGLSKSMETISWSRSSASWRFTPRIRERDSA